ncbi:hypothetical protein PDL71_05020 [Lacibacter sp. MH-610]|uniref:hypothetical protein n=1 Tax=Lacibacter sp. MH-610 TaxID=3020883 RepID=UPI0038921730
MKKLILFLLLLAPFSLFAKDYSKTSVLKTDKIIVSLTEAKQNLKTNVVNLTNTLSAKEQLIETCSSAWVSWGQCPDGREYVSGVLWVEYDCETNELLNWGFEEFGNPC